ncbi:MAG: FHA domain-containing protein [Akkermansiaceae bacterium]|jgi:pSer/pThr/pTyr-binding forkhead associated (FHA) protein|nr:FHA domain-containing protein [Akkermansiaceae bacterium]MDP4646406.1 FHA domain-containing protein [Akkermansiaceae bacterium]MDP4721517.1 FHA domain-containing protein [Akkermansiaceae bacterium]MDP4780009.1 FHA domain-containing protein [Akkermansiaceae bacterium]MDP4847065.1 FHA domain-containing protein [Akkermansiaceae bacterium]
MPRVIITVPDSNPQPYRFKLDREVVNMGRGSDNDIVIDSGSVSGKHAEMHRVKGGYELRDLGSTNGIKLNDNRQQMIVLRSGMTAHLGDVSFEFTLSDDEQQTLKIEKPYEDLPSLKEEEPKKKSPRKEEKVPERISLRRPELSTHSDGAGFGMIILFMALAAIAFCIGLSIRHSKDTGESLLKGMVNKGDIREVVPTEEDPAE